MRIIAFIPCEGEENLKGISRRLWMASLLMALFVFINPVLLPAEEYAHKITKTLRGITFDSNYDNGSLLDVIEVGPDIFQTTLNADPAGSSRPVYWFRFLMTGISGRSITLFLNHRLSPRPVIRMDGAPWRHMTGTEAPLDDLLTLNFPEGAREAEIAFYFPLGFEETYNAVSDIVRSCDDATSFIIGQSFQGRDLWMVSVTDHRFPDTGKRRVWVHARVHAGEATSTHVMLGILEAATSPGPLGQHLRRHLIFNIVPQVNADGIYLGFTRWDSDGRDFERQWADPSNTPETKSLWQCAKAFMEGPAPIAVSLNLHSTVGAFADTFFFKHVQPSVPARFEEIQQRYIDALKNTTPLFDNRSPATSQLHQDTYIESWFWNNWGEAVMAMTHEGHFHRRITDGAWITDEDYREIGRSMVRALMEYLELPPVKMDGSTSWKMF